MKRVQYFLTYAVMFFSTIVCLSNEKRHEIFPSTISETLVVTNFTTNPVAVGGTITICNGQSITYTDTSTGVLSSSVYLWSFGGGATTAANTAGPHTITYSTAGNYTTTLTIDGVVKSVNVVVTNVTAPVLNILNTGSGYSTSVQNGVTVFTRCGNYNLGSFQFTDPNSGSYPAGTTFNIVWGDSSPNGTMVGTHNYTSAGLYNLVYTVNYPGGCSISTNFIVFVGNTPPTVTISGSGGGACNPYGYQFSIFTSNNNLPGTKYTITINDGSAPIVFPNGLPSNPYVFNYQFPTTSCGNNSTINNSVYADSYSIQVVASNPCSPQGTFTSIGPIRVSEETNPGFSQSAEVACINSTVTFTDTSESGENVGTFGCNNNYGMYWEIVPNTGFTLASGHTLGSSNGFTEANNLYDWTEWTNGTSPLQVIFNQAGNYTIKMVTGNDCGMNETEHTICITPAVVADFSILPTSICAPDTITLTNTSSVPLCSNSNNYNWQVTQANTANCPGGAAPGWSFSSGNATSFEPGISFTSPGVYSIQLTTTLQNVVPGSLCESDVKTKTIIVKDKPSTVLTEQTICEGESLTISPVVNNCYATQAVQYNWSFTNAPTTISSTTSANPTMTFTTPGTYNYTLTLSNECGSRVYNSFIIVKPRVQVTASGPSATCLNSNIQLNGSVTGGATSGTWTASVPNGTFTPNASSLSPTYTPPLNYTGNIVFTLTSEDPVGPCPAVSSTVAVEFNAQAIADAGNYAPLCVNSVITLNGTIGGAASSGSWTSSNGGVFSNPNALNSTYTPPVNFVGTITLTLTTDDPAGPCNLAEDTVVITVYPTPTIAAITNQEVCNGTSVGTIEFTGTNATSYNWTNSNTAIGLGSFGSGSINFTAVNMGTTPISSTITVTPLNTGSGANCEGAPTSFIITVNPSAQVSPISNKVVCNGDTLPSQVFSTTQSGGTTEFIWTNSNNTIGLGDNGVGNLPQFTAVNTTSVPITATISVTPKYTNNGITCNGTPTLFTITVNPTGQVTSISNKIVCNSQQVLVPFTTSNTTGTTTYNWTNTNTSIGLGSSGSGNLNFVATNTGTTPITGTITVTPIFLYNGTSCIGTPISFEITINPSAQVNQPSNLVYCANDNVPSIVFDTSNTIGTTTYSWDNNTPAIGLAASGNGFIPNFTATNTTNSPIVATIIVTPFYTEGSSSCSGPSKTFTIIVNPSAQIIQPSNLVYCHNTIVPAINFSSANTGGTTTYSWTSDSTSIGIGASGSGSIPSFTASNTTTQPITATITVTPSFSNGTMVCSGTAKTFTITINPSGEINQPTSIEVCSGVNVPEIQFTSVNSTGITSYSWSSSNGSIGIGSSGNGSIPSFNAQNNTTSQISSTISVTPTFNYNGTGCSGTPKTFNIVVNASPNGTISGTANLCINAPQPNITFTGTSGTAPFTFTYKINNGTAQTISTTTGNSISIAVPTSTIGTFTYQLISIEDSNAVACSKTLFESATINIYPLPTISTEPITTQSICVGGTISALNVAYSGGTGNPSYQWYSNTSSSNSGGTIISSANQASYTPSAFTTAGTYYFYCVVSLSGSGCNSTTSQVAEVIVVADPVVSAQPIENQSLCQGTAPANLSVTVTGGIGNYTYQWYSSNSSTGTGTAILNATNADFTPSTTTVGTTYYYCVINQSGLGCSVSSAIAQIVVVPAPSITTQPVSSSICIGGTPTTMTVAYANGTGTASYQWYSNTTNSTIDGIAVGTNSASFTPDGTTIGTLYYYCVVTFSSGGCTNVTSNTALIEVNPLPTISTEPITTQSICVGGTISALNVAYSGGTGNPSYQWYSNTSSSNSGGTMISSANQASYTPSAFTTAGTYYFYCVVSLSGSGCNSTTSQVAEVIVVADPVVSAQPMANQSLCQGTTPANLSVTVSGGIGNYTYQWYSSNSSTGTGTAILNATNADFTPSTTTVGTTYYYCVINQSGLGCSVSSAIAQIVVVPAPSITTQPVSSSICIGGTPTTMTVAYANGTGTASYQWYSNTTNSTIDGIAVGTNSNSFTPDGTTIGTLYYYCVVTFSSGGCTNVTSNIAEVVINQIPTIENSSFISCSGDTIVFTPLNGNGNIVPSSTQYTWGLPTINPVGAISGETNQSTATLNFQQTLINTTNQIATATYTLTPVAGICSGSTFTVEVTVYPKPIVNFSSLNQTICNETSSSEISLSSTNPGDITFEWSATIPTGITGAENSGTNSIPIQTLTNTTNTPLTVIYTAFATFNYNGSQCNGPQSIYSITVNPTIQTNAIQSDYNGYSVSFAGASDGSIDLTISGGTGNYTFIWTDAEGNQFSTTEDVSNLASGVYHVTISDGLCNSIMLDYLLTEPMEILLGSNPLAQVNLNCFGDTNGVLGINITQESVPPYTYQLYNSAGSMVASINNTTDLNPEFTGLMSDIYTFTIIDANGGTKSLYGLFVTQPEDILIEPTTTPITCYGSNNASITLDVSGGTGPYTGAWDNLATGLSQTNLSAGNYNIMITDAKGCQKPILVSIPEAPVFMVNPIATNITCHGANNGSIQLNLVGGSAPLTLTWSDGSTSGLTRNNLGPGTYTATISDGTPCFISKTFTIVDPQLLVVGSNIVNATNCTNANSGAIDINVSGGVPPFNYVWSNGATTEDLNNIIAGNYSLTVTDNNGCSKTNQYIVTRPSPIALNVATQSDYNCLAKTVIQNFTAQSVGGVQPIQYTWSSGTVSGSQNQNMTTNLNGTIVLTATDAIGCTNNFTFDVNLPILGDVDFEFNSVAFQTYGTFSINDPVQFESELSGNYESIQWNFGDGQFSTELNPIHSYTAPGPYVVTMSVTYPFGCVYQKVISIIVTEGYKLIVPNAFTPNGDGVNDLLLPKSIGLTEIQFSIFDTWGGLIYSEQADSLSGWNGTINGVEAENGNYFYTLSGKTLYGTIITSNGPFVLIK